MHGASAVALFGAAACDKGPSNCNDVSSLNADQQAARTTLGYQDASTEPGKNCAKCVQYVAPPKVSDCGHCKVLAGTVHPNGNCRAFAAKT
jgi:hypothetical protein